MIDKMRYWLLAICILFFIAAKPLFADAVVLGIQGGIGPANANYIVQSIADNQTADVIIIKLDTPGGLLISTREIIKAMLASRIPIITYIAPSGARAASAGTFLLYASTIAAMAPGTHLGAASPVNVMRQIGSSRTEKKPSTVKKKMDNDAIAYIRSLAQLRGRNVDFAVASVENAATMTAAEAKQAGVIDVIARDIPTLLRSIARKTVVQQGHPSTLNVAKTAIRYVQPGWRMRFLQIITDPTMAYLFFLLGVYGIFFELLNPGMLLPGVVGATSMLLALYAFQMLPISYAGLLLLVFGISLIGIEAFIPSFGVLGVGGVIAFVLGSVFLIDSNLALYQVAYWAILGMVTANVVVFLLIARLACRTTRLPQSHGLDCMLGCEGKTLSLVNPKGQAQIKGEIWSVCSSQPIKKDTMVTVTAVDGLTLRVRENKES